ncbi:MAG: SoxR reducing system RseC family protein [Clostridia bacterium]|nr:SoxR reducing system RseC family protein [Clostridia bacterium]
MTQIGTVVRTGGGMTEVAFCSDSDCEKCGACAGGKKKNTLWARGEAQPGDIVRVEIPDGTTVKASLLAYVLPLAALIGGMAIGLVLMPGEELIAALLGLALMAVVFAVLAVTEKKRKNTPEWTPVLAEILPAPGAKGSGEDMPEA